RIVAIGTAEQIACMNRSRPVQSLATAVTTETLRVLGIDRRAPGLGEADQRRVIGRRLRVQRTGSVTRFADLALHGSARILAKDAGVQRVAEVLVDVGMATRAHLLADVRWVLVARCRFSRRLRECPMGKEEGEKYRDERAQRECGCDLHGVLLSPPTASA